MSATITVFDDAHGVAVGAADRIETYVRSHGGRTVTIGMAGGSTPAATYAELLERDIDWSRVYAWIGDERFVPPEHDDHNGSMVQRTLIDHTHATLFPVEWRDDASPRELAADYERALLEMLDADDEGPIVDILLAGIGPDGHTLSLFPGTDALEVLDRWYVANEVPQKNTWRLTATYALVSRAREVFVLVTGGGEKATALAHIMNGTLQPALPARRLMDHNDNVTWLVDRASAAELEIT